MGKKKPCEICGKEVDSRGYNNHIKYAHGEKKTNDCCESMELRALSTNKEDERQALTEGYTKVCKNCDELHF